jgi:hypothetical protein
VRKLQRERRNSANSGVTGGIARKQLGWRYNEPKYTIHTQALHISKHNPATQHKSRLQTNQQSSNCQTNPDHKTTGAEAPQTRQQTVSSKTHQRHKQERDTNRNYNTKPSSRDQQSNKSPRNNNKDKVKDATDETNKSSED